jgi:hypothetical protein
VIACIALGCIVSLLFPIVSMTDDLNRRPDMPEATKSKWLLASMQIITHQFSLVICPQDLLWPNLVFEQGQQTLQQVHLSFPLSRRPPPTLRSL